MDYLRSSERDWGNLHQQPIELILICRDGRLFGADPKGRVYTGELQALPTHAVRKSALKGTYEIPLKRKSPRGFVPPDPSFRRSDNGRD